MAAIPQRPEAIMEPTHPDNERDMWFRPAALPRPTREALHEPDSDHPAAPQERQRKPGNATQSHPGIDRLTQCLSAFLTRRGFAQAGTGLLLAVGAEATADAKKRKKRKGKKKKKGDTSKPTPTPTTTPAPVVCSPSCEKGLSCQNGTCMCASNVTCNAACCPSNASCVRGECCANSKVCAGNCCDADKACHNISPGGAMGCCSNPLVVRGETCCPTGSLTTRLNCGSYQCAYALSGSGPGGCDLWCKVGYEGGRCEHGLEGFPVPGAPDVGCCCGEILNGGTCAYP